MITTASNNPSNLTEKRIESLLELPLPLLELPLPLLELPLPLLELPLPLLELLLSTKEVFQLMSFFQQFA